MDWARWLVEHHWFTWPELAIILVGGFISVSVITTCLVGYICERMRGHKQ